MLVAAGVGGPVYTSSTIGDRVTRIEAKLDAMTEAVRELRGEVRVANDVPSEMSRTKALIREMVRPEALR